MRKTIFAIALTMGALGALTAATYAALPIHQTCDPETTGEFWLDGQHCIEGVQANCDVTHKCFDQNGNLVYECFYGSDGWCYP